MTQARRMAPMIGWVATLLAVGAAMLAAGHGALAAPHLLTPSTWDEWAASRPAPDAAIAVLRLVVLALDGYLVVATVVAVVLRLLRAQRAITVADLLTIPVVLRVVQTGLGVGLVGASVAAATAGSTGLSARPTRADTALVTSADEPPLLRELPSHPATTSTSTTTNTSVTTTTAREPLPTDVPVPLPVPVNAGDSSTWLVQSGDHLWSIAERTLAKAWARSVSDDEVVPYWREVIELNRARLADPSNPDLIFPGQTLVLPTPPPSGSLRSSS
jgi:hypothetical protein